MCFRVGCSHSKNTQTCLYHCQQALKGPLNKFCVVRETCIPSQVKVNPLEHSRSYVVDVDCDIGTEELVFE